MSRATDEPSPRVLQAIHRGWLPSWCVFGMVAPLNPAGLDERAYGGVRAAGEPRHTVDLGLSGVTNAPPSLERAQCGKPQIRRRD